MNLEHLYGRLDLFPEYLKAKLNHDYPTSILLDKNYVGFHFMHGRSTGLKRLFEIYNETGILIYGDKNIDPGYNYPEPNSFDEWLFDHRYYDLVDFEEYDRRTSGLINYVNKAGREIKVDEWGAMIEGKSIYAAGIDLFSANELRDISLFRKIDGVYEHYLKKPKQK